ncbi:hypothetical protein X975_14920, partial [Stegodyphus mimosarum]
MFFRKLKKYLLILTDLEKRIARLENYVPEVNLSRISSVY